MVSNLSHLDIPLQELQRTYENQLAGIDSIKTTVRTVFGSASLIVSLASALQLLTATVAPASLSLYRMGVAVIALLYLVLIAVCIAGIWPVYTVRPLAPEWDELTTAYKNMDEEQMKSKQLSSLLNAIDMNRPIVKRFARLQATALILLGVIVTLLLSLAWIPRA
jgi:hypothetical protein